MAESVGKRRVRDDDRDGWTERRRTLGGLLTVASRAVGQELHRRLEAAGYADLRPGSGNVFEHVGPEGSTVAAMAQRAGITPQGMVQVVDYLAAHGYVERAPDPTDRRAKLVRLTKRGHAADRLARATLLEIETEWGALLGEGSLLQLRTTLEDFVATLAGRTDRG